MKFSFVVENLWDKINTKNSPLPFFVGNLIYFLVLLVNDWRYARNWLVNELSMVFSTQDLNSTPTHKKV